MPIQRLQLIAFTVLLTVSGASAGHPSAEREALHAEIERLEQRIAALEHRERSGWIASARAAEIRMLTMDVLTDAEARSALRDDGLIAGHDGGFFVASSEGDFLLRIAGQMQVRFVSNHQSRSPTDDHRSGFELRRTQLKFEGHVIDPRLRYKVQGGFNRTDGNFTLLDAEIGWVLGEGWSVRGGQFRPAFLREDSTSSTRQLAVERSLVNARFAQNRMHAVEVRGRIGERVNIFGVVSDGLRSRNTPWDQRTVEFAVTGRAEWLIAGSWRQFRQFTSLPGEDFGMMIGGAIHWQHDEFGAAGLELQPDILRWTVDGQISSGGVSIFAAFIGSHEDVRGGGNWFRWGVLVQGAVRLTDDWELFARYEHGDLDEPDVGDLSVLTAGVNWYIDEHRLKWTTDVGYGFNSVDAGWAAGSAGWRADSPGDRGQIVVRSQFQLLF